MKNFVQEHTVLVFCIFVVLIFIIGNRVIDFTDFKEVCETRGGSVTRTTIGYDCVYSPKEQQ